jgi:hypothetical protein
MSPNCIYEKFQYDRVNIDDSHYKIFMHAHLLDLLSVESEYSV